MRPVVPPKSNRLKPWKYNKELYKGRNVVERNFRNIKQFRRVFTRYDKLDKTYNAFISFASSTGAKYTNSKFQNEIDTGQLLPRWLNCQ